MIRIVRLLAVPVILASACVLAGSGLAVGLCGVGLRPVLGPNRLVSIGAELIRSIRFLPSGPWTTDRCWVYFIQDQAGATKIGISTDPSWRRSALQTGHPEELRLIRTIGQRSIRQARLVEQELHQLVQDRRLHGEWFDLTDRQVGQAIRQARRIRP